MSEAGTHKRMSPDFTDGAIDLRQIQAFVEDHPLLSLGFVLTAATRSAALSPSIRRGYDR
jgi:hypothetical protein